MDESKMHVENMSEKGNDKETKNRKEKVLVYDIEKGKTTRCFIEVLTKRLNDFEFKDFREAEDREMLTLSIIAVVRHTSIRVTETLSQVKEQFDKKNIKDLKRVFVIYFYVNKSDEGCVHTITQISESGQFDFATIVPINFSGASLSTKYFGSFPSTYFLKTGNKESLQKLEECILSRKKLCVNVYGAVDWPRVNAFMAELNQYISSAIELQAMKPLHDLINETSPTLICTTRDVKECPENLKKIDLKKVFLCYIIDYENISTRPVMHDSPDTDANENTLITHEEQNPSSTLSAGAGNKTTQNAENRPWKMYEILYYNGKFKFDLDFIKQFETFVRTWSEEIKPPSE